MEMEQLALDEKQIKITNEERITIKRLQLEEKKLEIEEKIITINKRDKLSVKLLKLDLNKFDGNILKWTEFWDASEATIYNNNNLHDTNKFSY